MSLTINLGQGVVFNVDELPSSCPCCKCTLGFNPSMVRHGLKYTAQAHLFADLVFCCTAITCTRLFIARYRTKAANLTYSLFGIFPESPTMTHFDDNIQNVSPLFVSIYNEAEAAESYKLDNIAGPGYRKALEFLIKDYLILKQPQRQSVIEDTLLGTLISQMDEDAVKIKQCAKMAAWLGNDETHYKKKWEDKDIKDLKKLISLTVHYLLMELETQEYALSMGKV